MEHRKILEVKHLAISFTQYEAGLQRRNLHPIKDMNLTVRTGEITAVVGESGSGKSLLAHAVLGLMPYNCEVAGEIYYKGELLTEKRLKNLRGKEIVLVPQGVSYLDPLMKVGSQIIGGRKEPGAARRSEELLKRYGLGTETGDLYPFELSGGMARRVLIASALMDQPKMVIADEPTPGLDQRTALRVMGHFREIADTGAGVLLITHDLELAIQTADRILIFKDGNVVEEVTPADFRQEETLKHPYSKALYHAMPCHGFGNTGNVENGHHEKGGGDEAIG